MACSAWRRSGLTIRAASAVVAASASSSVAKAGSSLPTISRAWRGSPASGSTRPTQVASARSLTISRPLPTADAGADLQDPRRAMLALRLSGGQQRRPGPAADMSRRLPCRTAPSRVGARSSMSAPVQCLAPAARPGRRRRRSPGPVCVPGRPSGEARGDGADRRRGDRLDRRRALHSTTRSGR